MVPDNEQKVKLIIDAFAVHGAQGKDSVAEGGGATNSNLLFFLTFQHS